MWTTARSRLLSSRTRSSLSESGQKVWHFKIFLVSLFFLQASSTQFVLFSLWDIVNKNRTLILGFIWTLILRYQIKEGGEGGNSAKRDLIKWLNSIGLNVNNLTSEYAHCRGSRRLWRWFRYPLFNRFLFLYFLSFLFRVYSVSRVSWRDGKQLCNLLNTIKPGLIPSISVWIFFLLWFLWRSGQCDW